MREHTLNKVSGKHKLKVVNTGRLNYSFKSFLLSQMHAPSPPREIPRWCKILLGDNSVPDESVSDSEYMLLKN